MNIDEFPKVLIVGAAPIQSSTATRITLSNLFAGWPSDHLAQIYTVHADPEAVAGPNHFRLHPTNMPVDYHIRRLLTLRWRSVFAEAGTTPVVGPTRTGRPPVAALHAQLRAAADVSPLRIPRSLREWIHEQRPDVVYSPLGNVRMMRLARRVSLECRRPLVPHFMDDWPATLYADGELLGHARRAVRSALRAVIELSRRGMCISQPMATEYERRYGIPFSAFGNCVDEPAFSNPDDPARNGAPGDTTNLVYVGGLHLGRWRLLHQIGVALERVNSGGTLAVLTIHAPQADTLRHRETFAGLSFVRLGGPLRGREVQGALRSADILVHVDSFDNDIRRYTRLSLSTKIPQYLAAGRPILGYGPADPLSVKVELDTP